MLWSEFRDSFRGRSFYKQQEYKCHFRFISRGHREVNTTRYGIGGASSAIAQDGMVPLIDTLTLLWAVAPSFAPRVHVFCATAGIIVDN